MLERLGDPQSRVLVAEADGEIAAYASAMIADITTEMFQPLRCGLLADIYVSELYRRRGLGRALVERLCLWFRDQEVSHFEWHVSARNQAAMAFWEAIGGRAHDSSHARKCAGSGKMTDLLYLEDSYQREFTATVVGHDLEQNGVLLDRSAFYPGGGGQLPDAGALWIGERKYRVTKRAAAACTLSTANCRPCIAPFAARWIGSAATRSCARTRLCTSCAA